MFDKGSPTILRHIKHTITQSQVVWKNLRQTNQPVSFSRVLRPCTAKTSIHQGFRHGSSTVQRANTCRATIRAREREREKAKQKEQPQILYHRNKSSFFDHIHHDGQWFDYWAWIPDEECATGPRTSLFARFPPKRGHTGCDTIPTRPLFSPLLPLCEGRQTEGIINIHYM